MGRYVEMKFWSGRFGGDSALPMLGFALLCLLVGLVGFSFVQASTRQLLEAEARLDARKWSEHLSENVADLRSIAAGRAPSAQTIASLEQARRIGQVFSFRIYNAAGRLTLRSNRYNQNLSLGQPVEEIDRDFSAALRASAPMTIIQRAGVTGEPEYYASTLVPITDGQNTAGWLIVDIDQSGRQALFLAMTSKVSVVIGLLLIAAPVLGFWHRARQRALVEQTIETLARHDQLTGLPNKSAFLKDVDVKMAMPLPQGQQSALVLFEVSGAGSTSQTHGQDAEDHIVRTVAQRLAAARTDGIEIATTGRNVFGMFISAVTDPMDVLSLVKDLTGTLGAPVDYRGQHLALQIHAGIALSSSDGDNTAALMRSAELALHSAQEQGAPGYGFFNPEIAKDTRRRFDVQRAVTAAVASQSFRLDFQPIYNIRTGELNGFEALIRLHDPELGSVSPAEFIPIAEQLGMINGIGAWCLQEACRVAAQWPDHLMVSVNLSPFQFFSGSLISEVRNALSQNQFPSYRLEVEITEGTLLNDSELVLGQLRVLRDMGVSVALDDFGTGYSSLSYLWKFPFSKLKIDRSFVQALDETQSAKGILRSIVKLGHGLGLAVTAEGIENNKQFATLRDLGCDLAQGYLLDRPARVPDLAAIIMRNFANGLNRRAREAAPPAATADSKTAA